MLCEFNFGECQTAKYTLHKAQLEMQKAMKILYLLTELSLSSEAANCAATQELSSILWNPNVHYRVHKYPPIYPNLSKIDPVHTIPSYVSKM
jgi:hypothetical protein